MLVNNVSSKLAVTAPVVAQTEGFSKPVTLSDRESTLVSLKTVGEAPSQTFYERAKAFFVGILNWLKNLFCCCVSDISRPQNLEAIKNLAKRGYICFGDHKGNDPTVAFLDQHYACSIKVGKSTYDSEALACLATFHQQKPEIVKALSTYKAADLAKVYAEAEKITERAKTTPNDLTLLEQAFLDFANEDNEDYHQKIALAVLIDKFDNVPGLKEALLATGAAQIYKIEDGDAEGMYSSVRAELIERVRADLGGSKAELSCNDFQLAKVQAEQNKKLAAFFANKPL